MQTNHQPYKCDQIEILPTDGSASKLVSTGKGRTTCSYFLKGDQEIIYASTHESSPECPTPPDMSKGYFWGLFEYDIYKANADGSNLRNLTPQKGYDAEATVCPTDGSIVFTSDRTGDLELWRMDADGKNLRQLTSALGYDGGAFFSADCSKIVWRSSRPTSEKDVAEYKDLLAKRLVKPTKMDLYVANADGSDARQLTYLPGASFAPFFFPDGKRVIFSSNYQNPRSAEFDLYAIDIDGSNLERITSFAGFDGFPMFSPDGKTLAFSSNRRDVDDKGAYRKTGVMAGKNDTNVFLADWVDAPVKTEAPETAAAKRFGDDVRWLADDAREGRGVGTKGLDAARDFVRDRLAKLGVEPGVKDWFQTFEVTTEVARGATTALAIDGKALAAEDIGPLAASASGSATGPVVAVGWGIVDADAKLDDYKGKNVRGAIVLVHRFVPPDAKLDPKKANELGDLRRKAFTAKSKGAKAVLVIDDGDPKSEEAPLPKLAAAESESGIPVIVVTRKAGEVLRKGAHSAKLTVSLEPVRTKTANIVGVIRAGAAQKQPGIIVMGAHLDHLGMGGGSNAMDPGTKAVHNGADDNASGVAALLETARILSEKKAQLSRDVYIVAFSAEEMGALGAFHFTKSPPVKDPIVAMLNMDMVGRMRMNQLHVNGGDSAKEWKEIVEPLCGAQRVQCTIGGSGYGPSDHMPFYIAGAPVLFFFTGSHREYHTANDDSQLINAIGGARVAQIAADTAITVANRSGALSYVKSAPESPMGGDVRRRGASLGTVPSYSEEPNQPKGVVLSDVVPDGAAAKAGLKANDRIIQIGTHEVANVQDLMFVLEQSKPGQDTTIIFIRDGKQQSVKATFGTPRGRR
jgi:Tol biopolymer transport system component/membrane-associated protease RseP (regulator of RpoE activity)